MIHNISTGVVFELLNILQFLNTRAPNLLHDLRRTGSSSGFRGFGVTLLLLAVHNFLVFLIFLNIITIRVFELELIKLIRLSEFASSALLTLSTSLL